MKMENKIEVELSEMELPKLDLSKYVGQRGRIASADVYQGQYGPYLLVKTEALDMLGEEPLCASRIFSLFKDDAGNIGWGKEMKLGKFLLSMKVKEPKQLVGKTVLIQKIVKDDKDFLTLEA